MRLNSQRFHEEDLATFWQAIVQTGTFVRPGLQFGSNSRHFRLGFGSMNDKDLECGLQHIANALNATAQ